MEAKQIKDLMEAYASVYTQPEEQEVIVEDLQGAVKKGLEKGAEFMKKNPVGKAVGAVIAPVGKGRGTVTKAEQEAKVRSNTQESVDLFDYILEHLVAEGYADTNEAAIAIMANMSEDWKRSVIEQLSPEQEQRRRDLSKSINKAGTPGNPGVDSPEVRRMQKEFIALQKLKGV